MKLRLQAKYALMLGGVALGVSIALAALFLHLAREATDDLHHSSLDASSRSLMQEFEARGRGVVALLVSALVDPLYFEDLESIYNLTSSSLGLPDVRSVRVFDARGIIIHDGTRALEDFGAAIPPSVHATVIQELGWHTDHGPNVTVISGPILLGDRVLGGVTLTLDRRRLHAEIAAQHAALEVMAKDSFDRMLGLTAAILPLVLGGTALMGIVAARRMTRPIERLRQAAARIADGQFDIDWSRPRDDELGELADGLKKMVLQLKTKTVSMTYLDDIIGSMFDGLVVTEGGQRIEKINAATCRLTGYAPHELVNQPFAKLLSPPGKPISEDADMTLQGAAFDTIYSKSGAAIPVQMGSATMASHVDGKPRSVTVFRDVTHQREREAELRYAKEEAEVANASKSQFLANMSHELRTPLNAIIGFSSMIKEEIKGPLSDTYRSYAKDIHDSAQHLLAIINDILDISKLEAGKMELFEENVGLDELMPSVLRIVRHRAEERSIEISVKLASDLPDVFVDQRMMKQILINLISNAIKFNVKGGRVALAAEETSDGRLAITVSDTGIGMKPEDIPRLLEPFAQADAALNRTYEGTGLGLAITKSMVELHGGTLAVESAVGAGTHIMIYLPPERIMRAASNAASHHSL